MRPNIENVTNHYKSQMIGSATVNDGCDLLDSRYEGSDVNSGWFRAAADGVGNLDLLLINLEKLRGVGPRIGVGVNKGSFGLKYHLEYYLILKIICNLLSLLIGAEMGWNTWLSPGHVSLASSDESESELTEYPDPDQ